MEWANVYDKHDVKETLNSILIFSGKNGKKPKNLRLDEGMTSKIVHK